MQRAVLLGQHGHLPARQDLRQWVALNQIANLRLSGQTPAAGNTDGDIDYAGRNWHWRQEVVSDRGPGRGAHRREGAARRSSRSATRTAWITTVSGISGNSIGRADGYNALLGRAGAGLRRHPQRRRRHAASAPARQRHRRQRRQHADRPWADSGLSPRFDSGLSDTTPGLSTSPNGSQPGISSAHRSPSSPMKTRRAASR